MQCLFLQNLAKAPSPLTRVNPKPLYWPIKLSMTQLQLAPLHLSPAILLLTHCFVHTGLLAGPLNLPNTIHLGHFPIYCSFNLEHSAPNGCVVGFLTSF